MIEDCGPLDLPRDHDARGNLSFAEKSERIPFDIRRVCCPRDVRGGSERDGNTHTQSRQGIVGICGGFDIVLNDGRDSRARRLNQA